MKKLTALVLTGVFLAVMSAAPSGAAVKVQSTTSIGGGQWCCYA